MLRVSTCSSAFIDMVPIERVTIVQCTIVEQEFLQGPSFAE